MQQKEYTVGDWIKGGLFVIWFFGSIIGFFLGVKAEFTWLLMAIFGQIFLVIGIMVLISGIKNGDFKPMFLVFIYVGLATCVVGVIGEFGNEAVKEKLVDYIPVLGMGLFLFAGILLFVNAVVLAQNKKKCTVPLKAKCIKIKKKMSSIEVNDGSRRTRFVYCPVFEYTYNGTTYQSDSGSYVNTISVVEGMQYNVMIDPEKPKRFFEASDYETNNSASIILGVIFIVISVIGILFTLGYMK